MLGEKLCAGVYLFFLEGEGATSNEHGVLELKMSDGWDKIEVSKKGERKWQSLAFHW